MSLVNKTELETNLWQLELAIVPEDFKKAVSAAYMKQRGKISVPGFRKGKVPRPMIEKLYGKDAFYESALEELLPDMLKAAYDAAELKVVAPAFDLDAKLDNAPEDITVTLKVWTHPEIELAQYKELEAEKADIAVSQEEIDGEIEKRRERNARIMTVDGAAQDGDNVKIDFAGFLDDVAFDGGTAEDYSLTLGSGSFIPGFEEQLIGHSACDDVEVNVTFPEEYHADNLAGKPVLFKVKINEVTRSELPELDDEFAKDLGDYETLAELRDGVESELLDEKKKSAEENFYNKLFEKLIENVKGEIPPPMIEDQAKAQVQEMSMNMEYQGMKFDQFLEMTGQSMEDYLENQKPSAERRVRFELALDKIAELEEFEIPAEDLEAEYQKVADEYHMSMERVKEIIKEESMNASLKREKARQLVKDTAISVPVKEDEDTDETDEAE
ncbi:MAG: trigger factor [Oscillospiraceae bacterium]|nr:trigger factor [Oscillospiraceae bacterium]